MESPTQGNWIVDFGEGEWPLIFSEDGVLVADPMLTDEAAETDPGKIVANAYQIAASTEMRKALELFLVEFGSLDSHCGRITQMTKLGIAALAKANGEV